MTSSRVTSASPYRVTPVTQSQAAGYPETVTTFVERPLGCLSPVLLDPVVDDPESIRDIAVRNGPYFMPARYLVSDASADSVGDNSMQRDVEVPDYLIGPTWRGDWAVGSRPLVDGIDGFLEHQGFAEAARTIYDAEVVVPEQVYANLSTPMPGQGFSHTDIPEFVGIDRSNAPGWLLQAMGTSRLFEDVRITIVTAVAWFYRGERGFFRYWPKGRDSDSIRHEKMWNTAAVGDNDYMHHQVERIGPAGVNKPDGLTINSLLDHDGERWIVQEDGQTLLDYGDEDVRLSVSWKAKIYADEATRQAADAGEGGIGLDEVVARLADALGEPRPESAKSALGSAEFRNHVTARWNGYQAGR